MRTWFPTLFAVFTALPAQAQEGRAPYASPAPAIEAASAADVGVLPDAVRESLGDRPLARVCFDQPRADEPLWALGAAWKASFDGQGFTAIPFFGATAPRNFPMRFELASVTVDGKSLTLQHGKPERRGDEVHTDRGSLTEVVATDLHQLEQSFVFPTLPSRGAISVDLRIAGELTASTIPGGLRFANEFGHLDYTKAVAIDAKGARLPLEIERTENGARIEIPASFVAEAEFPLVLDPVLNFWFLLASGQSQPQYEPDVATIQASGIGGRTLIVYQRDFSAGDTDVFGVMFDNALGLVQTDFSIDFTSTHYTKIAVAGHNYSQTFLLVGEVTGFATWYVVGRIVNPNASLGSVFDIERDGVVGVPGNTFLPDVGSDPYFGVGRYCVVFMKRPNIFSAATTIYVKQVNPNGTLVNPTPTLIDTWATGVDRPSISKSCGQSNGQPANWLVTWQRTYNFAPNDQEVYGRFVNWNGSLIGTNNFGVAVTTADETAPSAGSPIDVGGVRYWPMCHATATSLGQPRDVVCKLLTNNGAQQASFVVNTPVPGADDRDPEIDSDGTRFVVTRSIGTIGFPTQVEAVTAAYLPASNSFRVEERTGLQTSSASGWSQANICADFSGGNARSPRYVIAFKEEATNTFRLTNFGGHAGGATFFFNQGFACGNLGINVTGSPVIGQSLTVTVGDGANAGVIFGVPGAIPLNALNCNCVQGVDPIAYFGNPLVLTVPNDPQIVGFSAAVQGFNIVGSQCLGFLDLSDAYQFTVR